MCNSAVAASNGNVVFIEKDNNLTLSLIHIYFSPTMLMPSSNPFSRIS